VVSLETGYATEKAVAWGCSRQAVQCQEIPSKLGCKLESFCARLVKFNAAMVVERRADVVPIVTMLLSLVDPGYWCPVGGCPFLCAVIPG